MNTKTKNVSSYRLICDNFYYSLYTARVAGVSICVYVCMSVRVKCVVCKARVTRIQRHMMVLLQCIRDTQFAPRPCDPVARARALYHTYTPVSARLNIVVGAHSEQIRMQTINELIHIFDVCT